MHIPIDISPLSYIEKGLNANTSCDNEVPIDCKMEFETIYP